jgi:hypothetical protein
MSLNPNPETSQQPDTKQPDTKQPDTKPRMVGMRQMSRPLKIMILVLFVLIFIIGIVFLVKYFKKKNIIETNFNFY